MEEISKTHIAPATKTYLNKKVIWGIAAFFLTVITSFVIYGIAQIDWSSGTSGKGIDFNRIDYSSLFNYNCLNIFMMVNVVLTLMLLDSYLTGKKKRLSEKV